MRRVIPAMLIWLSVLVTSSVATVVTFQQGVGGYSGCVDTYISAGAATTNFGGSTTLVIDLLSVKQQALIRFGNLFVSEGGPIPDGAIITSATITTTVASGAGTAELIGFHRMKATWDGSLVTWNTFGSSPWSAPAGIQVDDNEANTIPDGSVAIPEGITVIPVTAGLQAWSANPGLNFGWVLDSTVDDSVTIASCNHGTSSSRPLLTVTFEAPTACVDNSDCNDGNVCTTDTCNLGTSMCEYAPMSCAWGACNPSHGQCEVTLTFRDGVGDYPAGSTQDTYFEEAAPNTVRGNDTFITIDNNPNEQGLLRFDGIFGSSGSTRIPPGSTIRSATLTVFTNDASDTGAALHRMLACWSETDTFNSFTSGVQADGIEAEISPDVSSTSNNTVNSSHIITVTNSLAAWSAGAANLGWAFLPLGGSGWGLDSSEGTNKPLLSVTFTPPAACANDADCDDGNGCTDDTCNIGTGFCNNNVNPGNSCTDAIACTSDSCSACGRCVSVDGCTLPASCNISNGQCEVPPAPPHQPTNPSPAEDAIGVSSSPQLCVDVSDPDGGVLDVTFHGRQVTSGGAGDPFTIIALPDTQFYSQDTPPGPGHATTAIAQMQWIRDNRIARNIVAVTELGDCVDDADTANAYQWTNANASHLILENPVTTGLPDGIPYGICVGNHDQFPAGNARTGVDENVTTTAYNATFPKSRFAGRAYHGGNYPLPGFAESMDNHYELFSASGMDFIVFHFEWDEGNCTWPSNGSVPTGTLTTCQNVLSWAQDLLINTYPTRRAILTAHFMGTPTSGGTGTLGLSNQGQAIINMAKGTPNVFMALGGHLDQADSRTDLANDGRTIYTFVSDYQTRSNGGNGWLRIMTFDPQTDTIHVETYSPTLNRYINKLADGTPNSHADNLAAPENEFTVTYDMDDGGPFSVIDTELTASLAPDVPETVCVTWPSLATGEEYEWYVTIEDSGSLFTTGPRWFFTTADTCVVAGDCNDGDPCTTDTCPAGSCVYTPINGCCLADEDCTDGDPCTVEQCVANSCTFPPIVGCCDTSADCNDMDPCTTDTCNLTSDNAAAISFDGTNDYVTMGAAPGLNAESFTVEFWLRWTGANPGPTVSSGTGGIVAVPVVCKGGPEDDNSVVDANYFIGLRDAGGGNWTLAADMEEHSSGTAPGLNHPTTGATVIPPNEWHHAAIVYDRAGAGTGTWRLYLDGVLDGTLFVGQPPNFACTQHFALGTSLTSGGVPASSMGTGFFRGSLDEVRVWNVARSQAEIQANMGKELTSGLGLVGRWGLEEGSGTTAADSVAPQENGTLTAGPTWETTPGNLVTLGDLNECIYTPISNCCVTAAECDDSDICTDDDCVANQCENTAIGGCCHTVADCNDSDFCTTDSCVANVCDNDFITECCHDDTDCDDGNVCTTDSCPPGNSAALAFDGTNDHIAFGGDETHTELALSRYTIECWFRKTGTGVEATYAAGLTGLPLVTKGRGGAGGDLCCPNIDINYFLGIDNGKLLASYESGCPVTPTCAEWVPNLPTDHVAVGTTTLLDNVWYHGAITFDGTALKIYLNGNLDGTLATTSEPHNDTTLAFGIATAFDGAAVPVPAGFFAGQIDEVRVWNHARTQAEIAGSMNMAVQSAAGLVGRWGLEEGTGTTIADSTASANSGTLVNGPVWLSAGLVNLGSANVCAHIGVPGCCNVDGDCADGNVCTTDTCVSNACSNTPVPDCCNTVADCNDANACTTDTCISNQCGHTYAPTPGCCTLASHCNDGNECTGDACSIAPVSSNVAALQFGTVGSYVSMGAAPGLNTATFTLECWFRRTGTGTIGTTGSSGITTMIPLLAKGAPQADGSNVDANYVLGISTTGNVVAADFEQLGIVGAPGSGSQNQNSQGLNRPVCGSTPIALNTWYHLAAVYDGCWHLYLNGTEETLTNACASGTIDWGTCPKHSASPLGTDDAVVSMPRTDSIQHFAIGAMLTSAPALTAGTFAGLIDEVRVWSVARSQAQIQSDMSKELTSGTGLIGRWGLNEGTGTSVADSTMPAETGTRLGATPPPWVTSPLQTLTTDITVCVNDPAPLNGTSCNDGEFCTDADNCVGGVCTSSTPHDCDDGLTCTTDDCDEMFDTCTNSLDAGNCLIGGICYAHGALNPSNDCESCDSVGNPTSWTPRSSGSPCGSGADTDCDNPDTCNGAGVCQPNNVANGSACTDDSNDCTNDICSAGMCTHPPRATGVSCGDGTFTDCNDPDTCDGAGLCLSNHAPNGTSCSDGQFCTVGETCTAGACGGGSPRNCSDGIACTTDNCNETLNVCQNPVQAGSCLIAGTCYIDGQGNPMNDCQHCAAGMLATNWSPRPSGTACGSPSDTDCDNPDTCNGASTCQSNLEPDGFTCTDDGDACTDDICQTGACTHPIGADGTPCDDGDACTTSDECEMGACQGINTSAVDCNDGNPCTDDSCNSATGCVYTDNSDTCDDANSCTENDLCSAGACAGSAIPGCINCSDPGECNDSNPCTDDDCISGACVFTPDNSNDPSDGLFCNGIETCSGGSVIPGTPPNCSDGNVCTTDSCMDPLGCQHTPAMAGTPCGSSANTNCTNPDSCNGAGTCAANHEPDGTSCTDGLLCNGEETCQSGLCTPGTPAPGCCVADVECDDGNVCNGMETCVANSCVSGTTLNCSDGNPCTDDSCVPGLGCLNVHNTAPCSDGNPCTSNDLCLMGACTPGGPTNCSDGNLCTDDTCHPTLGCQHSPNNSPCGDGDACTTMDMCVGGVCVGGPPPDCDDGNVCTTDTCHIFLGCQYAPNTLLCDDGDACTTGDACMSGTCVGGGALTCVDGNACTDDTCNPATGCQFINNTQSCNDGNACTTADACSGGVCAGGPALNCNDGNPCTDDACDNGSGCVYVNNSASCNDSNDCTTVDVCIGGACVGSSPLNCNDANECTVDSCNPALGCQHVNSLAGTPCGNAIDTNCDNPDSCDGSGLCAINQEPDGTLCADGLVCNGTETCQGGVCTPGTPVPGCCEFAADCDNNDVCDGSETCVDNSCLAGTPLSCNDANPCTNDTCHPTLGCQHVDNTVPCDDGDACTTADACSGGTCVGGPPPNCNDANPCTDDSCDSISGCLHDPNTAPCNDSNACTTNDTCNGAGTCVGGPAPNCSDGNPCTTDTCHSILGCQHANNSLPCNDGNACTTADTCTAGSCLGGPAPNCNDGNVCTTDSCIPATGCQNANNTASCNDGLFCTAVDICAGGTCGGSGSPCTVGQVCDEGADACITTSNPPTVSGAGSRYLAITPPSGLNSVALRVESASVSCLPRYVNAAGLLVDTPVFQSSANWGTIRVGDEEVIPLTSYDVRSDVRLPAEPINLSVPATTSTWLWGDANNNGSVNIFDIVCVLDGFQATFNQCTLYGDDLMGTVPNQAINIFDIVAVLDAFSGVPYPDADPCALPRDGNVAASLPVAQLLLRPLRTRVAAGGTVSIDVYLDSPIDLRGYQLAVDVSSSVPGSVRLINAVVDAARAGFVFSNEPHYATSDLNRGRIAAATLTSEFRAESPAYLATFVFQVSRHGSGLLEFTLRGGEESMLLVNAATAMEIGTPSGITVEIVGGTLDNAPKIRRPTSRAAQ